MLNSIFDRPRPETSNITLLLYRDGAVLMPSERPIFYSRFIEHNRSHRLMLRNHIRP